MLLEPWRSNTIWRIIPPGKRECRRRRMAPYYRYQELINVPEYLFQGRGKKSKWHKIK
jgi:hypothetical protein